MMTKMFDLFLYRAENQLFSCPLLKNEDFKYNFRKDSIIVSGAVCFFFLDQKWVS